MIRCISCSAWWCVIQKHCKYLKLVLTTVLISGILLNPIKKMQAHFQVFGHFPAGLLGMHSSEVAIYLLFIGKQFTGRPQNWASDQFFCSWRMLHWAKKDKQRSRVTKRCCNQLLQETCGMWATTNGTHPKWFHTLSKLCPSDFRLICLFKY